MGYKSGWSHGKIDIEGYEKGRCRRHKEVYVARSVERPGLVTNRSFVSRQWGVYFRAGWGYNVGTIL